MFYEHSQSGIEGICQTRYVIQDDSKNNRATISKSKDLTDCQDSAVQSTGMAYIRPCPTCPMVGCMPGQALCWCWQGIWLVCNQLMIFTSYLCCSEPLESQKHEGHSAVHLQDEVLWQWSLGAVCHVWASVPDLPLQWAWRDSSRGSQVSAVNVSSMASSSESSRLSGDISRQCRAMYKP